MGEAPENPDDPENPGEPEESGIQGSGAVVHATLDVTAGDVLNLNVGGAGSNGGAGGLHGGGNAGSGGHPGGGGGGFTSIELGSELLLLAAGGGGSGGGHQPGFGAGGDAGFGAASQGAAVEVANGWAYPGTNGGGGYDVRSDYDPSDYDYAPRNPSGGAGAGATSGGAGGINTFSDTDPESSGHNFNGFVGTAFQGGNGGNDPNLDGSGGGGGLFGGGGGAATEGAGAYTGSGGGGGSSFVSNSALVRDATLETNRVAEGEANELAVLPAFATFEWVMCDYNLAITKSVVGVADDFGGDLVRSTAVFEDGDIARYSVTVTNDGPEAMAIGDTVTLVDDLAVGGTVVSIDGLGSSSPAVGEQITASGIEVFDRVGDAGSERPRGLAVGESVTVVYDVAVLGDEAVTNVVTTSDRNNADISADAVIAPAEPALQLVKSADTEKVTKAGQVVTYSFLVTNTGNIELSNIAIDEGSFSGKGKLPTPTCPDATVQPGESVTCSAEYVAVTGDLTGNALTNTATATGETRGGATATSNDSDVKITTVKPAAPLAVTGGAGLASIAVGGALLLALGAALLVARRRAGATS